MLKGYDDQTQAWKISSYFDIKQIQDGNVNLLK